MGKRIQNTIDTIRFLRKSEPKYSFEQLVVSILLGIACAILATLGEIKLWWMFITAFAVSVLLYIFRVWRLIQRRKLEYEEAAGGRAF